MFYVLALDQQALSDTPTKFKTLSLTCDEASDIVE